MTMQSLKKAVLLVFYRNPLTTVTLNLFGHMLLETVQKFKCPEMFSNEKLFKPMEELDTAVDTNTTHRYTIMCLPVTTTKMSELTSTDELTRIIDALHNEVAGVVHDGRCVVNSIRVGVNQLSSTDGTLDVFITYMRCDNE